ncbi:uncharacterized protein HD556DRAFT_1440533 [Suillus plorans]|uniref:DUF6533 domain-containing protein n=1 Tax=Suillus plorans TaxID=116603 RepID=A0A9P7DM34_9AGAM|nr:uncharacterized protein HD556DRAFT_1440533 [Suillus plorans]KAG1798192.1 hypothetical protein HD556DRAFT_1440533 [Suillus plorans]
MTIVSDDPAWWPTVSASLFLSYFIVAAFMGITYDWVLSALTLGQEVELIWRQHWSQMTVMYLGTRYLGILSAAVYMLGSVPTILLSDTCPVGVGVVPCYLIGSLMAAVLYCHRCLISYNVWNWTVQVAFVMLRVIIVIRLYAMYQRSRKILIFLVVTVLAVNIFDGVATVITTMQVSGEEFILSGTYQCEVDYPEDVLLLMSANWILTTVWEVLTLCLAIWIAVKHFRELRQHSEGGIFEDCFMVLMKTHVVYFASFVVVCCFELIVDFTPTLLTTNSLGAQIVVGLFQIFQVVQIFVLGPRLILGIREYHAKLVADADAATVMTSIAFQERVHISTGSGV